MPNDHFWPTSKFQGLATRSSGEKKDFRGRSKIVVWPEALIKQLFSGVFLCVSMCFCVFLYVFICVYFNVSVLPCVSRGTLFLKRPSCYNHRLYQVLITDLSNINWQVFGKAKRGGTGSWVMPQLAEQSSHAESWLRLCLTLSPSLWLWRSKALKIQGFEDPSDWKVL